MKPIKFYFAMVASRGSFYLLRMLGRNASHFPGVLAQKICPDVLKYLETPAKTIAITGTNGKTTTTNMIVDFLTSKNVNLVSNTYGSNIEGGIISSLLRSTTFFGKNKKEMAVLEVDERSSVHIFPHIKPDIIVVTNLYRDSYRRNAHVGYIVKVLESAIPKTTHLVLNADDVFTNNLCQDNPRSYFSIKPQDFEVETTDSIIQDAPYCLNCHSTLTYKFKRYHHIGFVTCSNCGYKTPKADFELSRINNDSIEIVEQGLVYKYKNTIKNITDNYNKLAAISGLRIAGYYHEDISETFEKYSIGVTASRYGESIVNGKRIVTIVAKRQNPIANSRVFDFVRKQKNWGSLTLILMNEEETHNPNFSEVESTAWHYDADFEYLNSPNVKKIYCMGNRTLEYKTRLVLAGINEKDIIMLEPSNKIDIQFTTDTIVILHDILNVSQAQTFRKILEIEAAK